MENDISTKIKQEVAKKNTSAEHPKRPGYGTAGSPVTLWANYFKLDVNKSMLLYRYTLEINERAATKTSPEQRPPSVSYRSCWRRPSPSFDLILPPTSVRL